MSATVTIKGLDKLIAAFVAAPESTKQELRVTQKQEANAIDAIARVNHRYISHSGNLERAIDSTVSDSGLEMKMWVSKTKSNAPYAYRIHEGYVGMSDRLGRTFNGPSPDQFLYNAAKEYKNTYLAHIKEAIHRALKKAGF